MSGSIQVKHQQEIVSIFLNRPKRRNALSLRLLADLSAALSNEVDEQTNAVIICGSAGTFSAGADISDLHGTAEDLQMDDAIEEVTGKIRNLPVPVIAAIDGPCMGGAFDLALSCDYRVASYSAFFQVPAARLGLLYNPRSVVRMTKRLGRDAVFRMLVLGERISAEDALSAGVVSKLVKDSSHEGAFSIARATAGNQRAAASATKQLLNEITDDSYDNTYDAGYWEERRVEFLTSEDRHVAITAERKRRGF